MHIYEEIVLKLFAVFEFLVLKFNALRTEIPLIAFNVARKFDRATDQQYVILRSIQIFQFEALNYYPEENAIIRSFKNPNNFVKKRTAKMDVFDDDLDLVHKKSTALLVFF